MLIDGYYKLGKLISLKFPPFSFLPLHSFSRAGYPNCQAQHSKPRKMASGELWNSPKCELFSLYCVLELVFTFCVFVNLNSLVGIFLGFWDMERVVYDWEGVVL